MEIHNRDMVYIIQITRSEVMEMFGILSEYAAGQNEEDVSGTLQQILEDLKIIVKDRSFLTN